VIQHVQPKINHRVGIKVSGGIRHLEQAAQYVALAEQILGKDWVTPDTFRIGASKLVDEIIEKSMSHTF
jgi:deoxyribose-phosphate aldolase